MASKKCEVPKSMRERIIAFREMGLSYRDIHDIVKINFSTVRYIIKKYEETGNTDNKRRSGRPSKLTSRARRSIVRNALNNPLSSAKKIAIDIASETRITVTPQTIRNVLHDVGLKGRRPRKKPFISEVNRKKRLDFALKYRHKPLEFWKSVIFSDESKFEVFRPKNVLKVWRKSKTAYDVKNILPTIKHGGGNVIVWGCMASNGVGNLAFIDNRMTARMYIDVLRSNLLTSARKLGLENSFYFQHDNDPKHTAMITKEWLLYNARRRLLTPPQSPDLNPIEHLWYLLEQEVRKFNITSKNHLKNVLQEAWDKIGTDITTKLIESMPRRLEAVIQAKGLHTKY